MGLPREPPEPGREGRCQGRQIDELQVLTRTSRRVCRLPAECARGSRKVPGISQGGTRCTGEGADEE